MTLGYGASEVKPFSYRNNVTVSFIKVFLFTEAVDFSTVAQPSPFSNQEELYGRGVIVPEKGDSLCLPLIRRQLQHDEPIEYV